MYGVSEYQLAVSWMGRVGDATLNSYYYLIRRSDWFFVLAGLWVPAAMLALLVYNLVFPMASIYHVNVKLCTAVLLLVEGYCIVQATLWKRRLRRFEKARQVQVRKLTRSMVRNRNCWMSAESLDDDTYHPFTLHR